MPVEVHAAVMRRHVVRVADGTLLRRPTVEAIVAMGRTQEAEPPVTRAIFDRVVCPLLLVYGRRYRFRAHQAALESIIGNRPDRRLVWLDAGHAVPLEAPAALAEQVLAFVDATGRRR